MSSVLAIADTTETKVELCFDDVLDSTIFERSELSGRLMFLVACIEKVLRTFEGPQVFGAEGRAAVEGQRHVRIRTLALSLKFDMVFENRVESFNLLV
jgi:hypothetical protein